MSEIKKFYADNLSAYEVSSIIKGKNLGDLVYEEINNAVFKGAIIILIYRKYYFRINNYATLTIIIDDTKEKTEIRAISCGSSGGVIEYDMGASEAFLDKLSEIFPNPV